MLTRRTPLARRKPLRAKRMSTVVPRGTIGNEPDTGEPKLKSARSQRVPKTLAAGNKAARKALLGKLDALARQATLARAGQRCEHCGKGERLQWHHVYSRSLLMLRHDLDNLVCLCAGCHLWWHHNPLESAAWFEEHYGPERRARLLFARQTRSKTDLKALAVALEVIVRQYTTA